MLCALILVVNSERQIFEKLFHGRFIYSYFYTTFVVCVNFIYEWRDLLFKVDSERHIYLRNFSLQFYLLLKLLLEICGEQIAEDILFVFRFDVWPGTRTLAFRLISQHTTY